MAREPTHFAEYRGKRYTIYQLAKKFGISHQTLTYRVKAGWPQTKWNRHPQRTRTTP